MEPLGFGLRHRRDIDKSFLNQHWITQASCLHPNGSKHVHNVHEDFHDFSAHILRDEQGIHIQ